MKFTGKVVGAAIGLLTGGPIGAAVGVLLGHQFDEFTGSQDEPRLRSDPDSLAVGEHFFRSAFRVMGHVAKADGRVSEQEIAAARAVMADLRLNELPIEAVVRGYLIGSGWKDYQKTGSLCGIALPPGMKQAERLATPLFTPASKAPAGQHDENISFADVEKLVGADLAARVRDTAIAIYNFAAEHARSRGIIIADTKFEFGVDAAGQLVLIDEVLTPDSSRFWPADTYQVGTSPPSFDKQFVRDYLETLDWNKKAPGPALPPDIIRKTSANYLEALRRLTS